MWSVMEQHFDIIVAGGGIAGCLAAARLADANPNLKILLLDKEQWLGGRLRSTGKSWSHGFNSISPQLYEFVNQSIKADPEADTELTAFVSDRQQKVGILSGSSVTDVAVDDLFTTKGARAFGGLAAARQWDEVQKLLTTANTSVDDTTDESDEDSNNADNPTRRAGATAGQPFSALWKMPRQSPAAVVLGHYAALFGIPDLWSATPKAILERAQYHTGKLYNGRWDTALEALIKRAQEAGILTIQCGAHIVNASQVADDKAKWQIETSQGTYRAQNLVVAMPPWAAAAWLPKSFWPTALLTVISKTKPVSAVVLTEKVSENIDESLPDVFLIPAEGVQAYLTKTSAGQEITFQATIDFEISHQAPEVVKAVKRLKRARRKLLVAYPGFCSENDQIALVPVGWAQSPSSSETKAIERLGKQPLNKNGLAFCGDAYGASYDGDSNLIKSVLTACEAAQN